MRRLLAAALFGLGLGAAPFTAARTEPEAEPPALAVLILGVPAASGPEAALALTLAGLLGAREAETGLRLTVEPRSAAQDLRSGRQDLGLLPPAALEQQPDAAAATPPLPLLAGFEIGPLRLYARADAESSGADPRPLLAGAGPILYRGPVALALTVALAQAQGLPGLPAARLNPARQAAALCLAAEGAVLATMVAIDPSSMPCPLQALTLPAEAAAEAGASSRWRADGLVPGPEGLPLRRLLLATAPDLAHGIAFDLTRSLLEGEARLGRLDAALALAPPRVMAPQGLAGRLHPGAARAYLALQPQEPQPQPETPAE